MKRLSLFLVALGLVWAVNAQAPYRHSIGVTLGNMEAFSYKTFFTDHLAFSVDAGYKWTLSPATYKQKGTSFAWHDGLSWVTSIEANPNLMYEASTNAGGLHWFVGGGLSAGYGWTNFTYGDIHDYHYRTFFGKMGVNAIGGIEYKFNFPLTLQADFRPGFGLMFNRDYNVHYFDWGVMVGARYAF
jgi:hypothetical protein